MTIKDLDNISTRSGVYLWKDKTENIIYIGKANNLKLRMKQYFKGAINSYKTYRLMEEIASYEIYIVKNSKEAWILENKLIKKHKPKYNIFLTDDKGYPYIEIALKQKLEISLKWRISKKTNVLYYGPFPPGYGARDLVRFLESEFLFENGLPIQNKSYEIWKEKFFKIKNILAFKDKSYLRELENKMYKASEELKFEIAHLAKNFAIYLKKMQVTQNIELYDQKNMDIIAVIKKDNFLMIFISFYRYGVLLSFKEKILETPFSEEIALENFLNSYYMNNFIPEKIILDYKFKNFSFELNFDSLLEFPQKGEVKKILDNNYSNLKNNLKNKEQIFINKKHLIEQNIIDLENLLNLKNLKTIVLIDNSHTANSLPVSVMVVYVNGFKDTSLYRKTTIKNLDNKFKADTHYMAEGFTKFLVHIQNIQADLILVDGGLSQVHEIKRILKNKKLFFNVAGLVKNDKHTTKYLLNLEEEKKDIKPQNLLLFLRKMQDEVDRYAKNFHRKKRLVSSMEGMLLQIPGIGLATEKKLLVYFKNHTAIYNASIEELKKCVSPTVAKKIKEKVENEN